ncbi:MAG: hypothetical protein A3J83_00625 [Elusimicrobia bacterium RIFOXYA2_FULL_40_6]|nr:MAG: hypothetical protein A3J83_00625 [Elusimicrobia bacterium RIFOXYA2_FULL_40_6]
MPQLHKKFSDSQVREFFEKYLKKEVLGSYIREILGVCKSRFFVLLNNYRKDPANFSIQYNRKTATRAIPAEVEQNIIKELSFEKGLIENKSIPLKCYNYSYVKDQLEQKHKQKVSLPTIINRAKKNNFFLHRQKRKVHDREVLTNYAGELIQHDSSVHKCSPYASDKWYLITSLDDYSRFILYAVLFERETSWTHISAVESVFLKYGLPMSYYVDCHSIFRFVQGRDSVWREHNLVTDEANPQWKQVLTDCNVKVTYALSAQAKGKIERPYHWLQDRIVRTCARENVSEIKQGQHILNQELHRYNYQQVHSTTLEVPYFRFKNALNSNKSFFRPFAIKPPFVSTKDIFCLRLQRTTDAYRKVSINNLQFRVDANPHQDVELRISPLNSTVSEVRIWWKNKLVGVQNIKSADLNLESTFKV